MTARADAKLLGSFYTPDDLVRAVVDEVISPEFVASRAGRPISVLDPACGDGRFLIAAAERIRLLGGEAALHEAELHGVDIDPAAVAASRAAVPAATIDLADALRRSWPPTRYDLVIGNPPFLSQMAEATTRGGASTRGGGPYADVAVEFLALGAELVDPDGGRLAFVLPQSLLASRDAAAIRARIDERAALVWSWWSADRVFDAQVHTCVVAFEFGTARTGSSSSWSQVVTRRRGVPDLPDADCAGRLGDLARLNANFRDEYYGLVPAVTDHPDGPPLVTSGLIDPAVSLWGSRPITFARRRWLEPRVDVDRLDPRMQEWARRRLVPKVLVANQTQIIEAVCDPAGDWLPGVPVIGVYPRGAHWDDEEHVAPDELAAAAWEIAAVLTSGYASVWLWHRGAGTGLSANTIRLSPVVLADLPWPAGDLRPAVDALQCGDLRGCARAVDVAYGLAQPLSAWWEPLLERIETRRVPMEPS